MRKAALGVLVCAAAIPAQAASPTAQVHFSIDPTLNNAPISPYIYGANSPDTAGWSNITMTRLGGNRWTAYNWENNASNAGSDYLYQNDGLLSNSNTPGAAVRSSIQSAQDHDAAILLTVPIAGYVAADKNGGGDVRNSGPNYLQTRFKVSLPTKGSAFSLNPNKNDAYVYQDEFVNWVNTNFPHGADGTGAPIFYGLDNEPALWSSTHAEIHPDPVTYAELIQKTTDYASAIKNVVPNAQVFGPTLYGWQAFENLQNAPDANGRNFIDTYLSAMKQAQDTTGKRLLDVLDLHWYPEATGGGTRITTSASTPDIVAARLQAPRSLWDPTYTETSWITQYSTNGQPINLLNRMQQKIDTYYPGTKLAITEYNYGGGGDISGGIAEADVLGIFGREGVFAADEWPLASDESFIAAAFQMYRNFDGQGGTFGSTSVSALTDDVAGTSIYASVDPDHPGYLILVAINKTGAPLTASLDFSGIDGLDSAEAWQLTSGGAEPQYAGLIPIGDPNTLLYTMPALSVSTLRVLAAPEPASLLLVGLGGLALLRRKPS